VKAFAVLIFATTAASLPVRADCPWVPEDFNDDAKVIAHFECRKNEMLETSKRAEAAHKDMVARLTQLHMLLDSAGDERLSRNQSIWWDTTKTCPLAYKIHGRHYRSSKLPRTLIH